MIPEYDRENAWEIVDIIEREYVNIDKKHQDEINRLKQQHAEEIEKLQATIEALENNNLDYITKNAGLIVKYDSYRQAVKDILGGEG